MKIFIPKNKLMIRMPYFWQYFAGFISGLCVFYFIYTNEDRNDGDSFSTGERESAVKNNQSQDLFLRQGDISSTDDKFSGSQVFAKQLDKYSRMSPDEIKGKLEEIDRKIKHEECSRKEYAQSLISIYYLAYRWSRLSPAEAINFKDRKAIDDRIFCFTYPSMYYLDPWDIIVGGGEMDK